MSLVVFFWLGFLEIRRLAEQLLEMRFKWEAYPWHFPGILYAHLSFILTAIHFH